MTTATEKRHPKEPPMRGLDPLFHAVETITVSGVTYGFRQIGLRDGIQLVKIIESAITWGLNDAVIKLTEAISGGIVGAGTVYMLLPLMGVRAIEEQVFVWVESLIIDEEGQPLPKGTLSNPEIFPLHEIYEVLNGMDKHPGLESFFGSLPRLLDLNVTKRVTVWAEAAAARYALIQAEAEAKAKAQLLAQEG